MEFVVRSKSWRKDCPPKKALIIRYQAMGDIIITLPYLNDLKKHYPQLSLHLFTRKEVAVIPLSLNLFDKIILIGGGRNAKIQFILSVVRLPFLWFQHYDVVMDLQNHRISRIVRKFLWAQAWCEFDSYSARSAGERTRNTIDSLGLLPVNLNTKIQQFINDNLLTRKLIGAGWKPGAEIVVINPAGAFETRHWPLSNYIGFAKLWLLANKHVQFLVTGLRNKIGNQVDYLRGHLGQHLIDLTGNTDAAEAFALMRKATIVVTEDSGLMHMAWVQGVPTLALFGSSRSDWSRPLGEWSLCLNSSDLPCGNCLLTVCKFGDMHCLTRYTPEFIFQQAQSLIKKAKG